MPVTLRHGDFHLQNLLWDEFGEPGGVWVVDWQGPGMGPAILDVSWFLGIGVAKPDLQYVRQSYLPEYHAALVSVGVTDYEYSQFLSEYRYGLLDGLTRMTSILATLDLASEDSAEIAKLVIGNFVAAAEDAGCANLIP